MTLRPLPPQGSASASFATRAFITGIVGYRGISVQRRSSKTFSDASFLICRVFFLQNHKIIASSLGAKVSTGIMLFQPFLNVLCYSNIPSSSRAFENIQGGQGSAVAEGDQVCQLARLWRATLLLQLAKTFYPVLTSKIFPFF